MQDLFDLIPFSFPSVIFVSFQVDEGHIRVRYEVTEMPINLPFQKPPVDKPNPKQGIGKPLLPLVLSDANEYKVCKQSNMKTIKLVYVLATLH